MKTEYSKDFCGNLKYTLSILFLFLGVAIQAQVTEEDEEKNDTLKGYNTGKVEIPNPKSIVEAYTYDPVTNRYIYTNKFEGFNITNPIILTPEQYHELVIRESMREYFQQKSNAIDGKATEDEQKNLLPRYYVNSSFFETLFGSNTIDIKPQGSVELDLGIRYTKQDNPSISPRNRKTFTFDFDQRISMSLQGKVGTRLNVTANYDTESTFAFQNLIKLEYTPTEDDILQKIEVGNVSFPLSNSLIRGAQSLFGVKMALQFGKTTVTGIFSEQKSQTKTVTAQGGGTLQDFQMFANEYDADKHFFLSQYFRNQYNASLKRYSQLATRVNITRVEVWITNRQNRINAAENNSRNIIAIQDIGEAPLTKPGTNLDRTLEAVGFGDVAGFFDKPVNSPPDNSNNKFDPQRIGTGQGWLAQSVREIVTVNDGSFQVPGGQVSEGRDYSKLENARKLSASEYKLHEQLGYISLNQRLQNDEVLAVAYQYTIGDQVFQVGEFGTDGVDATVVNPATTPDTQPIPSTQSLILKLLKSNLVNVEEPTWDLMMKNIYQIQGGFQLSQEDFKFNILYTDPSPLNYITPAANADGSIPDPLPVDDNLQDDDDSAVADTPLLRVFHLDRLNYTGDIQIDGDGFFDFQDRITIDAQNGRIIFTTVEPFGEFLYDKLTPNGQTSPDYAITPESGYISANQRKYVYSKLYKSTQADALQDSQKNKFQLRGRFKSTGGDGISLGAFNVPQGSVVVTAGGRVLVEGVDYTVNYQIGKVQILDPSLQASNTPIEVSVENNSVFGQQTRRFAGFNVEHKFNDKFLVGATLLNMSERPFTTKTNYGQESVNNTIMGVNANFATEVPFFTRMVNKLPNMDTDVPSNISFRGEFAYLKPGASKADQFNGEATTYVDDFEGTQTNIDMRSPQGWTLSSAPATLFNNEQGPAPTNDLSYGYNRAKLSWYSIDPIFYAGTTLPDGITKDDLSSNRTRRVYYDELYPANDVAPGQSRVVNTLDLSYFPKERGPYNFNPVLPAQNFTFSDAQAVDNWAGIMRAISSTNFEQTNVEYMQFWVMDPYSGNTGDVIAPDNTGMFEINLGELSEDILRDNRKQFENGLPEANSNQPVFSTVWGDVPVSQSLIYAFDTNTANRNVQDVGFDGLTDDEERVKYAEFGGLEDPSGDNYQFYLAASGNVLDRYKNYNGTQGNSPVDVGDTNRGSTTQPDTEDINRDNTMNTIDAYYRYQIPIQPNVQPGDGYVVDIRPFDVPTSNGTNVTGRWLLYKIPIDAGEAKGGISSIRSIRFMRLMVKGFKDEVTLRFGALDLVRGEWRRYASSLDANDPNIDDPQGEGDGATGFDVVALNVQENGSRTPIPYVSPPSVRREQLYSNNAVIRQNEQALSLRAYSVPSGSTAGGLEINDSRAVFKNVNVDMRQYKKLRMFLHAEALATDNGTGRDLRDNQMKGFLRFGNDFTDNFYQIEKRLLVTQPSVGAAATPEEVWPEDNEVIVTLDALTRLKINKLQGNVPDPDVNGITFVPAQSLDPSLSSTLMIGIKGNPNFGNIRTLMIGIKNATAEADGDFDPDPKVIRGEVWFNELRLSDMDNKGGWAAVGSMDTNFADFATLSATGRMSTIGFGTIEQSPNERSREDVKQYDIVTNVNIGKLLPKKWGINLPFNYGVGEEIITPEYDPFQQDIKLEQLIDITTDQNEKDNLRNRAIDYTKRKSINFIGVKKERQPDRKAHIYDPENLTLNYSFNQTEHHDYEVEDLLDQQIRTGVDYNFAFKPKPVEPLKNVGFMKKSQYWKLLSDFNFNYLPTNINFSTNIIRQYNRQQFRNVEVDGIPIDPLYRRNYFFNYQYGFNYNITKSLRLNYSVATSNIVRNYFDANGRPSQELNVWDDFWNIGEPNTHTQQYVLNYDIPINKIPVFSFVKSTYTYSGSYNWLRSNDAFANAVVDNPDGTISTYALGNTIQNSNSHKLNTTLNLDLLYKYVGLTGKKPKTPVAPKAAPKPGEKVTAAPKPAAGGNVFVDGLIGVLTSVKNIQINYAETNGTVLPGYLPSIGFFGTTRPTMGFIFGSQDDVREEAARHGYLTTYQEYNQNFTQVNNKTFNLTASVDLFPDFKIDLTADRTYAKNHSEQYDIDPTSGSYMARSPYDFGNFQISTVLIATSFSASDVNGSEAFDQLRANRIVIADRLAEKYYGTTAFPRYEGGTNASDFARANAGYPVGFGKNNQAVLLPAFLAAYSGQDAGKSSTGIFRDVPLPNWVVKYTGLMRYKFFKDRFKRFSLQHSYKASYNVNSYRSNLDFNNPDNPNNQDNNGEGNFINKNIISNINLTEQFNPLIRVDFEMKNSIKILAEIRKDRTLNMSFDNNLLTEVRGNEYVLGLGYRIKDVIITSSLADNPTNTIKSDINFKCDFTLRKNETIIRYLDYDNNQLGGGQNIWSVKFTADYAFSKNLTAIFYYDHSFSKAVISTSYPLTNIRSGFTLRYNFGN
ncbi:cell surface protein SprA [Flavobacterium sp. DG1-102-2]|uniref:T9SS outer membrane translocon Sov/SprA n=1 Tax=Flavobacterium sp. DG1-102-2 TaxID=3081663 RepID=UPI002949BF85|nr:cell surface protein SprA [Flavobacterium sp. DG1-102-2]MDV6170280.1 cell surface protein SprA [Flavobacterium sp. DG1-102-2]